MIQVPDLELPKDVAIIESENNSLFIVFIFSNVEKAEYFNHLLLFKREVDLNVHKEDSGKFTFVFSSSNSPHSIVIQTNRTLDNNPPLNKILDENYKEYSYLTCGYKVGEQVLYDTRNSYPLFLKYTQ